MPSKRRPSPRLLSSRDLCFLGGLPLRLQRAHALLAVLLSVLQGLPGALGDVVLLGLVDDIRDNVRTDAGTVQPVEEAPGSEVALAAALAVEVLAAGDAAEDDAGDGGVAGQGECFLEGDDG
jgi:hypothetical protein